MEDDRIDQLIGHCKAQGDGFANNMVLRPELLSALEELKDYRARPAHCPNCDGDHL